MNTQTLKTRQTTENLTKRLFNQPTAPFRESFVLKEIKSILDENKIPYFEDSVGQIIAGVSNAQKLATKILKNKTHVAFFAHTDHPGFIIDKKTSQKNNRENNQLKYKATWYGGAPFHQMEGKPVRIFSDKSSTKYIKGIIRNFKVGNHREGIPFDIETTKELKEKNHFGAFDFDGYKYKNGFVHTKCADDLAGCVMALGALIDVKKLKVPAIAVFTRAEEVGFVGCLHMIKSKVIPLNTMVVSLEASRTLPGALLGEGPVIRLGDASTLFDSNFSLFIQKQAQELKTKDKTFKFQKRIMDGGSCEATALSQFGYKTMGLAVPLKNYHNQGVKGPAPEIIHMMDIENGRKLLTQVAKNLKSFKTVGPDLQKRLMTNLKTLNKMLDRT